MVVKIANGLIEKYNYEVTLIVPNISNDVITFFNVNVRIISEKKAIGENGAIRYLREILFFYKKKSYIKRNEIILTNNFPSNWACIFGKGIWICNEPTIVEINYKKNNFFKKFIGFFILKIDKYIVKKYANIVFVADEYNKNRFINLYEKIPFINNYGINNNEIYKTRILERKKSEIKLIQVGVISEQKNQIQSLRSLKIIRESNINAKLIIVGPRSDARYFDLLLRNIKKNKLEKFVVWYENEPQEFIKKLLLESDIFLHPVKDQGGWLSVFEAIEIGVPVIVSKEFTGSDIILKNDLGMVTNIFDSRIIEYAVNLKTEDILKRRQWVKDNLSWNKFIANINISIISLNES